MFFVYILALIGLLTLLGIAGWVLSVWSGAPSEAPATDDPYDDALAAAARLQARAWEAAHELRQLGREPGRQERSG